VRRVRPAAAPYPALTGAVHDGRYAALSVPNYRRFVAGQSVSLVGSWTETVGQALLVLRLTDSAVVLGLATAARYLPVLLLTPYAGVVVDRHDKRRVLLATQAGLALLSLVLGVLVATGDAGLPAVFAVALGFGVLTAIDNPARQAFIPELVGRSLLRNAITLNSTMVNVGRAVGPLVAAALVAWVGLAACFLGNAASFAAVLLALATLDRDALLPARREAATPGQLREGLRYARTVPQILAPVLMMVLIGTLTYEFEVSLPLLARWSLHGSETTISLLLGAFGAGSVAGGLLLTRHPLTGVEPLVRAAWVYAAAMALVALAPSLWTAVAGLLVVGAASITFLTTGNATVQLAAAPAFRGRATALWSTAFVGSTPIGATLIGLLGAVDPRLAIATGAAACAAAALIGQRFT
jgi:MFS family permease